MFGRTLVVLLVAIALTAAPASAKRGPIDTKVTVAGKAASAQITVAGGGSISLKARNGTKVTVRFPAGAMEQDTLVSAALVTKLSSRKTRKGLLTGVQLQPEGLDLLKPATVRFTRRGKGAKGTRLVFVGTKGGGRDLYRLPPPMRSKGHGKTRRFTPTGRSVVSITHFSTVDAFDWSTATVADLDAILYPELGVDRLSQEIAKLLKDRRTTEQDLIDAYAREYKRFIDPLLKVASARLRTSCSVPAIRGAIVATRAALGFERALQLQGLSSGSSLAGLSSMITDAATCMIGLCPKSGDPRAATYFLSLSRQLQLVGAGNDALFAALFENMKRCGAYELRIDSRIDTTAPDSTFSARVAGTAKVVPTGTETSALPVRGALDYTARSGHTGSLCVVTDVAGATSGEFELDDVQFSAFDPEKPNNDPVLSVKIKITVPPMETYHSTPTFATPQCGTTAPPDTSLAQWYAGFYAEHLDFTFPGTDFVRDAAPVLALAVYSPRTITIPPGGSISENTLVEIVHTPLPALPLPPPAH
jgi:hypothetical protein